MTCLLSLPLSAQVTQSSCSGFLHTATCTATRLLTPLQRKDHTKNRRTEQLRQWHQQHPRYNSSDPFHLLPRRQQVAIFRLRTGHNRLNHHLFTKFRIGQTEQCPCGTGSQTTEHLLQSCPLHEALRQRIWPDHKAMVQKLYGCLEDLQRTVAFIVETGLSI